MYVSAPQDLGFWQALIPIGIGLVGQLTAKKPAGPSAAELAYQQQAALVQAQLAARKQQQQQLLLYGGLAAGGLLLVVLLTSGRRAS
jgi:hypothetical protein